MGPQKDNLHPPPPNDAPATRPDESRSFVNGFYFHATMLYDTYDPLFPFRLKTIRFSFNGICFTISRKIKRRVPCKSNFPALCADQRITFSFITKRIFNFFVFFAKWFSGLRALSKSFMSGFRTVDHWTIYVYGFFGTARFPKLSLALRMLNGEKMFNVFKDLIFEFLEVTECTRVERKSIAENRTRDTSYFTA